MKTQTRINFGFFAEVFAFVFAGHSMARGEIIISFIFLSLGLAEAFLVGDFIRKKALEEEYK